MKFLVVLLILGLTAVAQSRWTGRIVGGSEAEKNQFPHQIALSRGGSFTCGGSIIKKNWVLTAAHCVDGGSASQYTVEAGMLVKGRGTTHKVKRIIPHEKYGNFMNDIALIQIEGEFNLDESRQIVELGDHEVPTGDDIIVSGWGRVSTGGSLPVNLKWNTLKKVGDKECGSVVGFTHGLMCLGHPPNQGVCNGDSGGPALHNGKVVGVANFVIGGCGSSYPDGYCKVATFIDWIEKNIEKNSLNIEFL